MTLNTQIPRMDRPSVRIPGIEGMFSLSLPMDIAAARDKALALHSKEFGSSLPALVLSDAAAWSKHTPDEDWLIWRARRCAARLKTMPIQLESGERVVGRPRLCLLNKRQEKAIAAARVELESMPRYPGGDCGHFNPDFEKLLTVGIGGLLQEVRQRRAQPDLSDESRVFYDACEIALQGLTVYVRRVANACKRMAVRDAANAERWLGLAGLCRRVATKAPQTFEEAIQLLFVTLIALWFAEDHGMTNTGRLDRTLRPFYEADLAAGRITPRAAFEAICSLYIQLNRIYPPGLAQAVMVGGQDGEGRDVTNELTYLCLAARWATKLVYPTLGVAWHEKTPEELTDFAITMLTNGMGDPAFFNDDLIADGLRDHGVSAKDARNYMNSTCVEIKPVGTSHIWVTAPYFNVTKGLLEVIEQVTRGEAEEPATFEELSGRVKERLAKTVADAAVHLDRIWHERAATGGFPLASCLIADCLERGRDFDRGGARYNWVENSFVGLANLVDGLIAVRHLVYTEREMSLADLGRVLEADFEGHEDLSRRIATTLPRYGTDNDEADELARVWADFLMDTTEANMVGPHRYVPGFFCWIMHGEMGRETGATPDGRRAGWPLADGAGAAQGRERLGPTASVLSTTKWSHRRAIGGLVHNLKLSRSALRDAEGRQALRAVIETYLQRGGFEIQVNVVSHEDLLDAQKHPELYQDLLVRVAGYSDYFVHLSTRMQNEVIARTEHELMGSA